MGIKVSLDLDDGVLSAEEWCEVGGYLRVFYKEGEDICETLPALSKSQWQKLKKAGDFVFDNMEQD